MRQTDELEVLLAIPGQICDAMGLVRVGEHNILCDKDRLLYDCVQTQNLLVLIFPSSCLQLYNCFAIVSVHTLRMIIDLLKECF